MQLAAWAAFNNVDIDNPLAPNGVPLGDWVCGSSAGDAIPNFEGNEIFIRENILSGRYFSYEDRTCHRICLKLYHAIDIVTIIV